jgi:F-box and WD-40 domain protein 1/11
VSIPSVASQLLAARASRPRLGLATPSRATLAAYLSAGAPPSTRKRSRAPSPRGLIPRLFGSLGAPHKRGKHRAIPPFAPDGDAPLDGEEGELVDEACFFVDLGPPSPTPEPEEPASADPFGTLPPELALRVLALLDARALAHCAAVCHAWRALALDNLLWAALFAARASDGWAVDTTRLARPESRRRPPAMDRRGSERSLASTLARARKNSTRSLMSWRAGKTPALAATAEETAPAPAALALDWRKLYESRQLLDRRWASAEPAVSKISGHSDRYVFPRRPRTHTLTPLR